MFAQIILPLPLQAFYTYRIPEELAHLVCEGVRVVVHFGAKRFYAGIVESISSETPTGYSEIKEILDVLDEEPIVTPLQIQFWKWMATYYMCSVGEVMNAALPSGLKMESSTLFVIHPDFNDDFSQLSDDEYMIAEAALRAPQLTAADIQSITGRTRIQKLIKTLVEKRVLHPVEELEDRYVPKRQKIVQLNPAYGAEGVLNALMVKLEKKSAQQYQALLQFFNLAAGLKQVTLTELNKLAGTSAVSALVKKEVFLVSETIISRIHAQHSSEAAIPIILSPAQQNACTKLSESFVQQKPVLLYGVTGSGKTEIYLNYILQMLKEGRQVLYLLPEIGLTSFIVERLRAFVGNNLYVYHSRFNPQEKVEIWQSLINRKGPALVVGARSALFLPFSDLGLIIVDEEHDTSYKQQEPAPRYHARDSAVMLSKFCKSQLVLGSATPSLETWHNCMSGQYNRVDLTERFGNATPPEIQIIDIRKATFQKKMVGPLSPELFEHTRKAIDNKRQVILFQNRRGYSTWIECEQCGWAPVCRNCDVSMTWHKNISLLKCHYCGFTDKPPQKCPSCGSSQISMRGLGTQRIEDELGIIFHDKLIARMDMDTTRGKKAVTELFKGFDEGRFQILVGTQMVTKGLDFSRVDVVGILNGDNMVSFPDFRAHEHAFQTMMQVAGRAGRRDQSGKVFIQVYDISNPVARFVASGDVEGFMMHELESRRLFLYPPFTRLIRISLLHKDKMVAVRASVVLKKGLQRIFHEKQLLGPEFPPVARVRNFYYRDILVKLQRNSEIGQRKQEIQTEISKLLSMTEYKGVRVISDVDPV